MYKLSELLEKTQESTSDVFELLADNEKNTNDIFNKISISKTFTALDCAIEMDQHLDKIDKLVDGELIGCDTGFSELNKLTSGWQNSDLIILAARPGMGKTSLMLNFVNSVLNQNKSVLVFSLEMSKLQLYARMCSQITSIPLYKFLKEKMNPYERELYKNETFKLSNSQLFIEDKSGISINFIKVKARKLKRDKDISMIVIDYIGLIDKGNTNKSTNDQVAEISGALKGLAKELNIPIILLSQLSREVEKLNDKRPMLSHLRDSGAIEQDADMVMFIYRPEYYGIMDDGAGNSTIGKAELIVAKHRNGALSDIIVNFNGNCTNFY
jgi:replicative DNA helicase